MTDLVNQRHAICRVRKNDAWRAEGTVIGLDKVLVRVVWDKGTCTAESWDHLTVIPQPAEEAPDA